MSNMSRKISDLDVCWPYTYFVAIQNAFFCSVYSSFHLLLFKKGLYIAYRKIFILFLFLIFFY